MPQGGTWGIMGVEGQKKVFFSEIQPDLMCELFTWMEHATAQLFGSPSPGALGWGQKSISKIFKPNFVLSQIKDIKYIRRDFHSVPWVMPQGLRLGAPRVKNLIF